MLGRFTFLHQRISHLFYALLYSTKWFVVYVRSCNLWKSDSDSVFGGQIIGQALVAAGNTVAAHLTVHSMHCYFLVKGIEYCRCVFSLFSLSMSRCVCGCIVVNLSVCVIREFLYCIITMSL